MKNNNENVVDYCANIYHTEIEQNGDVVATTLYKNGRIILYEETVKEIKRVANYGDFEISRVLKRIHFDDNGNIIE